MPSSVEAVTWNVVILIVVGRGLVFRLLRFEVLIIMLMGCTSMLRLLSVVMSLWLLSVGG